MATTMAANDVLTQMYIDGAWCDAPSGKTLAVINPADESVVAEVAYGTREDAERAIAAAERAFPGWRAASAYERAKILKRTAELMRERADRIARTLTEEQGKPLAEARLEVLHAADTFEWFAEEGKRAYGRIIPPTNMAKRYYTIKHPVGVVATITPWNFPAALAQPQDRAGARRRLHGRESSGRSDAAHLDHDVRVPGGRGRAGWGRQPGDRAFAGDRRCLL